MHSHTRSCVCVRERETERERQSDGEESSVKVQLCRFGLLLASFSSTLIDSPACCICTYVYGKYIFIQTYTLSHRLALA